METNATRYIQKLNKDGNKRNEIHTKAKQRWKQTQRDIYKS